MWNGRFAVSIVVCTARLIMNCEQSIVNCEVNGRSAAEMVMVGTAVSPESMVVGNGRFAERMVA